VHRTAGVTGHSLSDATGQVAPYGEGMWKPITPAAVTHALEHALFPILGHLVREHGAEALHTGLLAISHHGRRTEVRQRETRERNERAAKRRGQVYRPDETPPAQLPRPVVELSEREVYDIRRRHRLIAEGGVQDDLPSARADLGTVLADNDRLRTELLRTQDELEALRSQLAVIDEDPLEHQLAMLGVEPSCSCCGAVIQGEAHVLAAASRWSEDEADEYDRDVEVCAACARGEKPAAPAEEPRRQRLASGVRKVEPSSLPIRKAG
jgi:hypothetical protein